MTRTAASFLLFLTLTGGALAQPKRELRTGMYRGRPVTFEVKNGWAVVEGDIIIGRPQDIENAAPQSTALLPRR